MSSVATRQAVRLSIFVEASEWASLFNRLEVWRSRNGDAGPFEPLTGDGWAPARVPASITGAAPSPYVTGPSGAFTGKTLELLVNETTPVVVTLAGSDPLTFHNVATQTTAQGLGLVTAFVSAQGKFVVETLQPGSVASLRVTGGDAAPTLGLSTVDPGNSGIGSDPRIFLLPGVDQYVFVDTNGDPGYAYRTRFFDSSSGLTSDFSLPFSGAPLARVSPASLVQGYVDLTHIDGGATVQKVLVYNRFGGTQVEGKTIAGGGMEKLVDGNGHAEFTLVRGALITVALAGSNLVRDVVVPTDPSVTRFDMFDAAYGHDDVFNVQKPNIDYAVRRSL